MHSLGGLIVRAALPGLIEYKRKFNLFISLSSPHLGISSKLIEGGLFFLRFFRKSEVLEQLTLKDSLHTENCLLSRLSTSEGLNWFRRVIFVGSSQDGYSLISSSTINPDSCDETQQKLARNLSNILIKERTMKIDVEFEIPDIPSIDSFIGRAAHIKFLESPVLVQLLLLVTLDLLET
jgi:hypothetical protein